MDLYTTSKRLTLILAGWAVAFSAAAQWQWLDKDGRKVFSDRSPPSDIKEKDILKQPRGSARPSASPTPPAEAGEPATPAATTGPLAAASAAKVKASAPRLSGKDAELQAKKKKLEEEQAEKKKAEEEKFAQAKAANCDRAKKGLVTVQSGVRLSNVNAQGEREVMDDNGRAAEIKRLQAAIESDCK